MSQEVIETPEAAVLRQLPEALERAAKQAAAANLPYAGRVDPEQAWTLAQNGEAVLVDVRTAEERKFVGFVPGSVHVPWATGTSLTRNPRFVRELEARLANAGGKHAVILLLCRSGQRSAQAAEAAHKAGFTAVFGVLEGFEGGLNDQQRRGLQDGWRYRNLPWIQD